MVFCHKSIPSSFAAARRSHKLVMCPQETPLCPPGRQGETLKTHRHLLPTTHPAAHPPPQSQQVSVGKILIFPEAPCDNKPWLQLRLGLHKSQGKNKVVMERATACTLWQKGGLPHVPHLLSAPHWHTARSWLHRPRTEGTELAMMWDRKLIQQQEKGPVIPRRKASPGRGGVCGTAHW